MDTTLTSADLDIARSTFLLEGVPDAVFRHVMSRATLLTARAGEAIFRQDEPADRLFVLLYGWVRLYRVYGGTGLRTTVALVRGGETFAEEAGLGAGRHSYCADALTGVRLLAVNVDDLASGAAMDERVVVALLNALSVQFRRFLDGVLEAQSGSAGKRIARFLLRSARSGGRTCAFELPFNQNLIAEQLCMQPETFSRALKKLRLMGVEIDGSMVTIRDRLTLHDYCGEMAAPLDPAWPGARRTGHAFPPPPERP